MSMLSDYKKKLKAFKMPGKPSKGFKSVEHFAPGYMAWNYKSFAPAEKKQKAMKKMYGYTPEIMQVSKHGKVLHFTVVEPKGLTKVSDM